MMKMNKWDLLIILFLIFWLLSLLVSDWFGLGLCFIGGYALGEAKALDKYKKPSKKH
jgi:hypothetical protein